MSELSSSIFTRVYDPVMRQSLFQQSGLKAVCHSLNEGFLRYSDFVVNEFEPLLAKGRMAAEVVAVVEEANQALSIVLKPSVHWRAHTSGQYVSVEVDLNGVRYRRYYSLSSSPDEFNATGTVRITVKRVSGGRVSNYLHEHLLVGQLLHISQPAGDFTLEDGVAGNEPLFIAAGSGITPIMAMIESLSVQENCLASETNEHGSNCLVKAKEKQSFSLIYVVRAESDVIFAKRLAELAERMPSFSLHVHVTEKSGRLTKQQLSTICADVASRQLYVCGPYAFMESIHAAAKQLGVAAEQFKRELFGVPRPDTSDLAGQKSTLSHVSFNASGVLIKSSGGESLLDLAEQAGLKPKYGCRAGVCHECTCQKVSGRVMNMMTGKMIPEEQGQIQACISAPVGDLTISNW